MNIRRRRNVERRAAGGPLTGPPDERPRTSAWDDELGRALREAPAPPHAPDHFARVRERLRDVGGAAGRPPAPRRARPGRPGAAPPASRRSRGIRLVAVAAVAAAVIAAVAVSWSGVPGIGRVAPPPATAETVLARVQSALASLGSISGDVVEYGSVRGRPYLHRVGSFTFTASGDYRIVDERSGEAYTYDSVRRVARRYVFAGDGTAFYAETARDLPDPGPFFNPWMGSSQVLDRSVAAYARAVIAELDPGVPVTPIGWEGRAAWSVTVPEPLTGGGGSTARIVVDAESGYPLAVEHRTSNGEVMGTRIENVLVGGEVPRSRFRLRVDVRDNLLPMSERFRRMSLRQAAALGDGTTTAFTPYRPSWVPDGYRLCGVTGAVDGAFLGRISPRTPGRIGSLTVVLTYRRGFDRFCLVSRWRSDNPPGSDDPFDENSAALTQSTPVRISAGSLRGATADVVLGLPDWPHLYVSIGADRRVSVSVAGDLTRDELARIAGSLRPIGE